MVKLRRLNRATRNVYSRTTDGRCTCVRAVQTEKYRKFPKADEIKEDTVHDHTTTTLSFGFIFHLPSVSMLAQIARDKMDDLSYDLFSSSETECILDEKFLIQAIA